MEMYGTMYTSTHDHFVNVNDMIGGTMKRLPVFLPEEHAELLREMAFKKRTSVSEEIRKAVEEYLDKMKEEKK
jgi:hypothetical protein